MCLVARSACAVCCGDRPGFTLHVRGEWVVWVSVWGVMGSALAWWWWEGGDRPRVGVWKCLLIEPSGHCGALCSAGLFRAPEQNEAFASAVSSE